MSSPRYTDEGVKIAGTAYNWRCGDCGAFVYDGEGVPRNLTCPSCGMKQRPDWNLDLVSERLHALAIELKAAAYRHDSMIMLDAAAEIRSLVTPVTDLEKLERLALSGVGVKLPEPVGPSDVRLMGTGAA